MPGARITHVEFPADDMERAKRFYAAVAGWEFRPMEGFPDYELFSIDDETGGAIGARGTSTGTAIRIFITVPDLERARDAAHGERRDARRGHHGCPRAGSLRRGSRSRGQRDRALAESRRADGRGSAAPRAPQDLARHDLAVDLVGALVDLGALGVAHQPLDAGLARVPARPE